MEKAIDLLLPGKEINNLTFLAENWANVLTEESHKIMVHRDGGVVNPTQFKEIITGVKNRMSVLMLTHWNMSIWCRQGS